MKVETHGRFFPTVMADQELYPSSDRRFMPESDSHRICMLTLIQHLMGFYQSHPDVYVSGDLLLYYERGNRKKCISPDCFVVKGVPNMSRTCYLLWSEGLAPNVAFEIASKSTHRKDLDHKFELYRDVLKIPEYFIFDPEQEFLTPTMQGYRLIDGDYQPIEPNSDGRLVCEQLQLELVRGGNALRFWNPATQALIPTEAEITKLQSEKIARQDELIAEQSKLQEQNAAVIDQLKQELERLRAAQNNGHGNGHS